MNLPNKLSLVRVALIPVMVALMYIDSLVATILATVVYALAAYTDYLDGHIARRDGIITSFGKFIDPVADKLLNLSALLMLTRSLLIPHWCVVLILARELCVDGLRMVAVTQGHVIAAGWLGKIKTVSQMVLILWLMITQAPVFSPELGIVSTIGCLWVLVITLWSGVDYIVRNRACIKNIK